MSGLWSSRLEGGGSVRCRNGGSRSVKEEEGLAQKGNHRRGASGEESEHLGSWWPGTP